MVAPRSLKPPVLVRIQVGRLIILYDIMIYANEKNRLWNMCQLSIGMLEELMKQIEKAELQNEQFVLDWLDKMNELSVKY